ncbi:MAG: carboxypeptidase regulatory-like domain-containing protein [Terracidiphilus sp.]
MFLKNGRASLLGLDLDSRGPLFTGGLWRLLLLLTMLAPELRASTDSSISGTVTDPKGQAISGAAVTVIELNTNFKQTTATDSKGFYSLTELAVGRYEVSIDTPGFKQFHETNLILNANSSLSANASLLVGGAAETVTVESLAVHVESVDTQLGEVIRGEEATAMPLNGRSFTDLLSLQPGVVPQSSFVGQSLIAAGASLISPSGTLDPGTLSISGQREFSNGFSVNGASIEEPFTMGAGFIPNLDSIDEFRILTTNVDAEYGNYSGGQINVITKSGGNRIHGDVFDFVRNTALDARDYFSATRGTFQQNQYGGTAGGPIRKDKLFYFGDFQGTQMTQGESSGEILVPSNAELNGDFSDPSLASSLTGCVSGPYIAGILGQSLGSSVQAGDPYWPSSTGCTPSRPAVFPNNMIPKKAWSGPAVNLVKYIPGPNLPNGDFSTNSQNETLRDFKGGIHIDANSRWGRISGYYGIDDYALANPYPIQQGGATIPGFSGLTAGRSQLGIFSDTKTFGSRTVNFFEASYLRDTNILGTPDGTVGTSLTSQGFVTSSGGPSILPQRPSIVGVENIIFNNFTMGSTVTGINQYDNIYQYSDTLSHVIATHTLKFGGELRYNEANGNADIQSNGEFAFFGSETGLDIADFFVGAPSTYEQGNAQPFYMRNRYGGAFVEDSWRIRRNLTFNYGVRWEMEMPFYEKFNQLQTLVLGEQSQVYPGAPTGIVFPLDKGVPNTLSSRRWNDFSPRLGLAWSPAKKYNGVLGSLLGNPGDTSIRLGAGRFFTAVEGITAGVMAGDPPYGTTYSSPVSPLFSNPFIDAGTGFNEGQRFPLSFPAFGASPGKPNNTVDWAQYEPISGMVAVDIHNVSPYAEEYNLSIERQLGHDTVLGLNYIGSEGHHQYVLVTANPGIPSNCLRVSQLSQVAPGSAVCGPFSETGTFTTVSGQVVQGRGPFGANFGGDAFEESVGNSNYNALEVTLRHQSGRLDVLAGYTYGKSLDISSSIADMLVPGDPHRTYELSAFDIEHNFVASYNYNLPVEFLLHRSNRLTQGWIISGIAHFSTGLPVTMQNSSDHSLIGARPNGVNPFSVDLPQVIPGPLHLNHHPQNGNPYFNISLFGLQPLGTVGNVSPRYFFGPGLDNYDMALEKSIRVHESSRIELRLEAFNVFNRAQFFGSTAVNGDVNSTAFGQINSADAPRLVQTAVKFAF